MALSSLSSKLWKDSYLTVFHSLTSKFFQQDQQMSLQKSVSYTYDRHYFSIQHAPSSITITIDDFQRKIKYLLQITQQMLPPKYEIAQLYKDIYKTFIYNNKGPRQLLTCQANSILITPNYPDCRSQPLLFEAEVSSTDDSKILMQKLTVFIDEKMAQFQKFSQSITAKLQVAASQQLHLITSVLQQKTKELESKLEAEAKQKVNDFLIFCKVSQSTHEEVLRSQLQASIAKILTDNKTIVDEIYMVKATLQRNISTLNGNLQILDQEISHLNNEILDNKQLAHDQIGKLQHAFNLEIEDLQQRLRAITKKTQKGLISQDALKGSEEAVLVPIESTQSISEPQQHPHFGIKEEDQ